MRSTSSPCKRIDRARRFQRLGGLSEDVVGELVSNESATARDAEAAVAGWAPAAELVDADALRRDADPGVSLAHVPAVPERVEVVARGDVLPLHQDRAVEADVGQRSPDHDPRPVRHVRGELDARGRVRVGGARDVVLLLDVLAAGKVLPRREERVCLAQDRGRGIARNGAGNRPLHDRAVRLGRRHGRDCED